MAAAIFDAKHFNGEVFQKYLETIPNTKLNELIRSRAVRPRPDLANAMSEQTGGNYITTPLRGLISGSIPDNYDGVTDITADSTKTFRHSRIVVGRAKGWTEKDFSYDITGGEDFMANIARQVAEFWSMIDQETIVHILNGVFNMTDDAGRVFVDKHTHDVTKVTNSEGVLGNMDGTTLNTAMQKACGDHKNQFSMAIMHSKVATNLENLKLLVYLKYNDANGLQRDLSMGTLNGRLVMVDDSMPSQEDLSTATFAKTSDTAVSGAKTYYTRSGSASAGYTYTKVDNPRDADIGNYYEKTGDGQLAYTTYVFGDGAIEYTNCGAKVPSEMSRNPGRNGGEDTLYNRQRKCFSPYGISFTQDSMATLSPTNAELELGSNWELVNTHDLAASDRLFIDHKAIPIGRIISLG